MKPETITSSEPVDQGQVAVVVDEADVAGGVPAVGARAVGAVGPVAGEQVVAPDPDLARVLAADARGPRVDDPYLDAGQRAPTEPGCGALAAQRAVDDRRGLGQPIALFDREAVSAVNAAANSAGSGAEHRRPRAARPRAGPARSSRRASARSPAVRPARS